MEINPSPSFRNMDPFICDGSPPQGLTEAQRSNSESFLLMKLIRRGESIVASARIGWRMPHLIGDVAEGV